MSMTIPYDSAVRRRSRLLALTVAAAIMSASTPSLAQSKRLAPESAAEQRDAALSEVAGLDNRAAAAKLVELAEELGDPELFLAASELLLQQADVDRDDALALEAEELARTAADIAIYLSDEGNYKATRWRPVTRERATELAGEAKTAAEEAASLAETIVEERRAAEEAERARLAAAAEQDEDKKRELGPGSGLIIGGSVALVVGVGGVAMLGAGLGLGAANQREAESLMLPAELARLDQLDRKGAQANTVAYVGGAVAAVGLATGVALLVVGVKKRKAAGADAEQARIQVAPYWSAEGGGLQLQGKF
jgi:hypothetical protein